MICASCYAHGNPGIFLTCEDVDGEFVLCSSCWRNSRLRPDYAGDAAPLTSSDRTKARGMAKAMTSRARRNRVGNPNAYGGRSQVDRHYHGFLCEIAACKVLGVEFDPASAEGWDQGVDIVLGDKGVQVKGTQPRTDLKRRMAICLNPDEEKRGLKADALVHVCLDQGLEIAVCRGWVSRDTFNEKAKRIPNRHYDGFGIWTSDLEPMEGLRS
jgi:hypothetical protein